MDETTIISFEEAGIDIVPVVLEKLLCLGCHSPLKNMEDVIARTIDSNHNYAL